MWCFFEGDNMVEKIMNNEKGFIEIKMSAGWYMTISMIKNDKFEEEKEYVEIAKVRGEQKRSRFNINPKYVKILGDTLIKFANENKL